MDLSGKKIGTSALLSAFAIAMLLTSYARILAADDTADLYQPTALYYSGTYQLRENDPTLTGAGTKIATICRSFTYVDDQPQNDYRINVTHDCLANSNIVFAGDNDTQFTSADISSHATAIGGILAGSDLNGFHPDLGSFHYQGAAPDADLTVYEFQNFLSNYIYPAADPNTDILTLSMGEIFSDWWTRGLELMAQRDGLIIIAGIGNGTNVYDPVLYPAAGANVIGVGVIDSLNSDQIADALNTFSLPDSQRSSSGPTDDNRCKPDIVAPGNCITPDASSADGYVESGDWTSFAAPVVAGTVSLLVQKAKQQPELAQAVSSEGGNCVIKAILMNSATKLAYWHKGYTSKDDDHTAVLDHIQGAGAVNAAGAYDHLIAGKQETGKVKHIGWDNNAIGKDEEDENVYIIDVPDPAGKFITATLIWNRHYEDAYPFEAQTQLDSDLRIELWAVDLNDPNNAYMIDHSDSENDNVEHIHCPADPNYTNYEIVVIANDSNDSKNAERYGIAWQAQEPDRGDPIWWYDLNADGKTDLQDIMLLFNRSGKDIDSENGYVTGDINMDGQIDTDDLSLLIKHIQ